MHYVLGFQFNNEGSRVALIKKRRPTLQEGFWNGIGGHVERGETTLAAMVREFAEETGITQQDIVWLQFASIRTNTDNLVSCFLSFTDQVELVWTNSDELVSIHKVSELSSMADRLVPDVTWLVAMALSTRVQYARSDGRGMYVITELPPAQD